MSYQPAITNYLDDFLFIAICIHICKMMMETFLTVCQKIGCPISDEKTEWPTPVLTFLGTLLNGTALTISIPQDKVEKARYLLKQAIDNKKVQIKFVQQLTGTLNFLNRAIVPGRAFTRGMYDKLKTRNGKGELLKPHHHVFLNASFIQDCWVWLKFLEDPHNTRICRPFIDFQPGSETTTDLILYSNASKNPELGMGAVFQTRWLVGQWPKDFIKIYDPSIEFLELLALVAALLAWRDSSLLKNTRVNVFCDNQAVQCMVNSLASSCDQCRKLIRVLAYLQILNNIIFFVKFVRSRDNILADSLSRLDYTRFWKHAQSNMNKIPDDLPTEVWPPEKVWNNNFDKLMRFR